VRQRDDASADLRENSPAPSRAIVYEADRRHALLLAVALSLGSAIALGLARFSYALLLPPMRLDLAWNFAQAGAMNTANAFGYLLGALAFSRPLC
jgi:predicted MFS family arabinose efflux permease